MMTIRAGAAAAAVGAIASMAILQAQVGDWTTSGFDAQRTAWLRSDARLTKDAVQKGTFQFLWKAAFDNESRQLQSLTEPVLQDLLIGYRGFKALAFVGGSADRLFAIDTDLARPYWTAHLNYAVATGGPPPSSWECPGGLLATPSRRTALAPSTFTGGGGGRSGRRAASAVGEPGKGAAVLSEPRSKPVPRPTGDAPAPTAAGAAPRRRVAPVSFGGVDRLYAMGSDGLLRTLRVSDGAETSPPIPFLPPSARPSSLIFVDGIVYTSTSNGCGAAPNAVWAVDLTTSDEGSAKKVVSWKTGGASVIGTAGPAFGTDGTLYVALGSGPATGTGTSARTDGQGAASSYSNAVVALDRETLAVKDWFTTEGAAFTTSPIVFRYQDKELVAAAADDGRIYLLQASAGGGASLGGGDHKTPLFTTPRLAAGGASGALATWDDGTTRWILAAVTGAVDAGVKLASSGATPATRGSIVAFKVVSDGGKISLAPGWQSRDLLSPLAPIVVNGLVMAASSGEFRGTTATQAPAKTQASAQAPAKTPSTLTAAQRAQRSTPAVLYVLDGTTGKELWSSGKTIASFARAGLSAGGGQVYLVTYDNHLYAFGIPMEH